MSALIYQPGKKWRLATACVAAAMIHLAAIAFASTHHAKPKTASGFSNEPPEIFIQPLDPSPDPQPADPYPLPTPPAPNEFYVENTTPPPPVRRQATKFTPIVKERTSTAPRSLNFSAAKVLALNAPRPEYPYEARRRKITGEGVALMSIDSASGRVTSVTMVQSTGNAFLDDAAITGFLRWRFKPGTVSSITCPVTFTLTGAAY